MLVVHGNNNEELTTASLWSLYTATPSPWHCNALQHAATHWWGNGLRSWFDCRTRVQGGIFLVLYVFCACACAAVATVSVSKRAVYCFFLEIMICLSWRVCGKRIAQNRNGSELVMHMLVVHGNSNEELTKSPHCNTIQHTATHYIKLQHAATYCNTLLHTDQIMDSKRQWWQVSEFYTATFCKGQEIHNATLTRWSNEWEPATTSFWGSLCNTLQNTATHWNTLQYISTDCNILTWYCNTLIGWWKANDSKSLQCTLDYTAILLHTVTHCNTLQYTDGDRNPTTLSFLSYVSVVYLSGWNLQRGSKWATQVWF